MHFLEAPGDATDFDTHPNTVYFIPNGCNNRGIAGSGFIIAVKKRFPKAILEYEKWYNGDISLNTFPKCLDKENCLFEMGNIQLVNVASGVYVVNMLTQKGFGNYNMPPGRYESIEECLRKLKVCCEVAINHGKSVHIHSPKFGAARSGLAWTKIYKTVKDVFKNVPGTWTTYSYEGPTK